MNSLPLQDLVLSVKGLPRLARFLPKVVLALLVSISAEGYKKLAIWLNDMGMTFKGRFLWGGRSSVPTGNPGLPFNCPFDPQRIIGWRAPTRSTSLLRLFW